MNGAADIQSHWVPLPHNLCVRVKKVSAHPEGKWITGNAVFENVDFEQDKRQGQSQH